MKAKARKSRANELQFELKYCERCGGLWLRPAGGGRKSIAWIVGARWRNCHQFRGSRKRRGSREDRGGTRMTATSRVLRDWIWTQREVWHEQLCGMDRG
jgi:Zn-finger nucleic acid-binding protein